MTAPAATSADWCHEVRHGPDGPLVCFPSAGASASSTWQLLPLVPDRWALWGVQYPGRGPRLREPMPGTVAELAAACVPAVAALGGRPVLFGHSFGALVAYEAAHLLETARVPLAGLLVAGLPAPGTPRPALDLTDDAALVAAVRQQGGTASELLADDELMELVLPALRVDLELAHAASDDAGEPAVPLDAPIAAVGGSADPLAPVETVAAWRHRTRRWLGATVAEGDHFVHLHVRGLLATVLERSWPAS